ncbi:MAG TPA: PASTA domain-containing protein [Acidimicrobiales bacterium]|nr:PASTA domain-containing protein [Acidimicrobiales bacterium]
MATSRIVDHVGRVLGDRYRLVAPVGTGASAHVFLADDVSLRRRVAVKVLHAALADDESFLRRFRAEAQAAAALNHPHIMRVFDWGEADDGPYVVLEHLAGGSLRDLLDRGVLLSPEQAVHVGLQAARGLEYAHRRGLVHRDIKPANLLFDDEGRLCIADFGLARALAEAAWTEPGGAVLGTARYASPEQAQGSSVDGKADVYSLALVLVELVTGRVPFAADTTIATLMARVGATLDPPAELGPLGPVVQQAAAPETAERLDAAGLVTALERVAAELPAPELIPVAVAGDELTVPVAVPKDLTEHGTTRARLYDHEADAAPALSPEAVRRRRRWPWVALLTVVALLVAAGAAFAVIEATKPTHAVPSLRGKTVEAARAEVADEKFKVRVARQEFHETAPAGEILDQDPSSGKLKEGDTIKVVVSQGPSPRQVPELAGLDEAGATARLTAEGFAPKVARRYDETAAKGAVLDWQPRGMQAKGTEILVTVSDGPTPKPLAELTGKAYDEAAKALTDAGLVPVRKDVFSDEVETGKVVSTTPPGGTPVTKGSRITVNVSKGPETVAVPNVIGQTIDQARAALEAAGLQVAGVFGPPKATRVFQSDPGPGVKVKKGTAVALYVR